MDRGKDGGSSWNPVVEVIPARAANCMSTSMGDVTHIEHYDALEGVVAAVMFSLPKEGEDEASQVSLRPSGKGVETVVCLP